LVFVLAEAGRKKLTTLVLGSDQERALRQAATAALQLTVAQLDPSGGEQAEQLTMVVSEVFREPTPDASISAQATVLQALQAGIAEKLAVLDDAGLTGTGQSSAAALGVPGSVVAEMLAGNLVREIMLRGSRGGPLAALADQLNHDVTHLQGQRLEGMLAHLADQVTALAQAGSVPALTSKPVRLLPRPTFLSGREDLLAELDARLARVDRAGPVIVALCGLGGVGKTSLAMEYAHRHLADVGLVWQFAAHDLTVLEAGFSELAAQLGAGAIADSRDPVASVHGMLAAFPAEWLLVFDNVPDRTLVERFLPPAGPGRILITSQNPSWPHGQALEVPLLGPEVAADFIVTRTGDQDREAAQELAGAMDGLPLALEQAAAYILATGGTLAEYLGLFRERRGEMLRRGEPADYPGTVATTWALAFSQLEESSPAAVGLLRLLAFCAPEPIPLRLLLRPQPGLAEQLGPEVAEILAPLLEDSLPANDAIAALRRYSLVSPAGYGSVSVHRLVQAVTVDQMPSALAEAWRQATAAVVGAAIPENTDQPESWPACAALLPHVQAAVAADSDGTARMADYLGSIGSYAAARELQQKVAVARERVLGPEHPTTLEAFGGLADWTGKAGDAAGARDQLAALLPVYERVLGSEHADTLAARSNLTNWIAEAGDAAGARDQLAALLPIYERVSGPEHPDTLAIRANLANWTGEAGDATGARDQFAALLPICERVLGAEDPGTLTTRGSLAHWTGETGDTASARREYAALLDIRERVFGREHPDTLAFRANLANWSGKTGDAAGARDQVAALLPIYERVLGSEHPHTLATRGSLAHWTAKAGDAAGARDQLAALLPIHERVLGSEHPQTLATRTSLANWTGEAGDAAGARDQLAALLPIYERVLGAEHPDTLTTRGSLARWTGRAGDAAGARAQFAALLPIQERVSGPEHPDSLTTRANLANWTGEAGDAAGARREYAALLPIHGRVFGPSHPDTLTTRANLANWTGEAGNAIKARHDYAALLPIRERVSGPEHPDTLAARSNLANWTGEAGDAAGARDQLAALVPICEQALGPAHPRTLTARSSLAHWTGRAGDAAGARDQLAALLPIHQRVFGPRHPETLTIRGNIAQWTGRAGDAAVARDQLAVLLPICERVLGAEHPLTLGIRDDLAFLTRLASTRRSLRK
jgi:hypothetical protein